MSDLLMWRHQTKRMLMEICAVLAEPGEVDAYHIERLTQDRDTGIYHAIYDLQTPALEVAQYTGLPWTEVYDIADRLHAEMLDRVDGLFRPKQ